MGRRVSCREQGGRGLVWREQAAGERDTSRGVYTGVGEKGCGGLRACVWGRIVNLVERAGSAA